MKNRTLILTLSTLLLGAAPLAQAGEPHVNFSISLGFPFPAEVAVVQPGPAVVYPEPAPVVVYPAPAPVVVYPAPRYGYYKPYYRPHYGHGYGHRGWAEAARDSYYRPNYGHYYQGDHDRYRDDDRRGRDRHDDNDDRHGHRGH
jgi:hypothetical protein